MFAPGTEVGSIAYDWEGSNAPDDVFYEVTDDPLRFSVQREGVSRTGERTIDTCLDQIVFGSPIASFDLWQKSKLNETSRRTNNQCGIDVIVASAQARTTHRNSKTNVDRWRSRATTHVFSETTLP